MDSQPTRDTYYALDFRDVKHPRLEFKTGTLLLVLPKHYQNEKQTLEKYQRWIQRKQQIITRALEDSRNKNINQNRTEKELRNLVNQTAQNYQTELNTKINHIYFRKMKTKWASHSQNGNLTINTLLKYVPESTIQYVVYHETAHSIESKHNERFWNVISRKFPNYETLEKDLLTYWFLIQKMTPNASLPLKTKQVT
jgi:predicted metal-dependent hydrolase